MSRKRGLAEVVEIVALGGTAIGTISVLIVADEVLDRTRGTWAEPIVTGVGSALWLATMIALGGIPIGPPMTYPDRAHRGG